MISIRHTLPAIALLACTGFADTIHKTDGTSLEDCTVVEEGLTEVTYNASGSKSERQLPSDEVLRIEFEKLPVEIDRALTAIGAGNLLGAAQDLDLYLRGIEAGKRERRKWAPAYAMDLLIQQFVTMGKVEDVLKYCDMLIQQFPESRLRAVRLPHARGDLLQEGRKRARRRASLVHSPM